MDHLVPVWTGLPRGGVRSMAVVLGGYVAAAVPVVYFGLGDVMDERSDRTGPRRGDHRGAPAPRTGCGPVRLPLAVWPGVLLLWALLALLPPFAAFAIYFGGWHAPRHTARLLAADPRDTADVAAGSWRGPLRPFARCAAAPPAVVLASVVVLVLLARRPDLFVPVLSVLLALTVPPCGGRRRPGPCYLHPSRAHRLRTDQSRRDRETHAVGRKDRRRGPSWCPGRTTRYPGSGASRAVS